MSRIKVTKLLVYDCEATCWEDMDKTKNEGELIEIGIVPIDLEMLSVREDLVYSSLVKPVRTKISQHCTIKKTSKEHGIKSPFEETHYNLKNMYSMLAGCSKEIGLAKALERENMVFKGNPHTALDDAVNTAYLIVKYLKYLRTARIIAKNV